MHSDRILSWVRLSLLAVVAAAILAGCGSVPKTGGGGASGKGGGGYYKDDGPGANPPPNLDMVPDALPQVEPLASGTSKPYVVLGKRYVPDTSLRTYRAQGIASWYGRKFHGARTSDGEIYDMYGMTAAHPTLPIPSYARVTRVSTGKSVLVRINDRGPFHDDRLIDLSYTAAYKLGIIGQGSAEVVVESLMPDEIARIRAERSGDRAVAAATVIQAPEPEGPVASALPVTIDASQTTQVRELAPLQMAPANTAPATMSNSADAVPAPATTAPYAAAVPTSGIFLQLGAFSSLQNAQDLVTRVRTQLGDWTEPIGIVSANNVNRVNIGPYASRDSALAAAQIVRSRTDIAPVIVAR